VPPEPPAGEDTRVWIGKIAHGHQAEHARFLEWLNGAEAESIFRRRRLTEYLVLQDGENPTVTVVFKAPHTGDPRIMIDFLRYPGMWPEYWEFERAGRAEDIPDPLPAHEVKVHWQRAPEPAG
jgi:hypothetical protein